jgi:tRNA nucleotidyltransferase (CCA-adding enzyme)
MIFPRLPDELHGVFQRVPSSYLVGGSVRDAMLGLEPKDFDIEVYGLSGQDLIEALTPLGKLDLVGKSFGVIKLTVPSGQTYDVSLARRDSKGAGVGHKNFTVDTSPDITIEEGCSRRDLTINSMLYDPRKGELVDPYEGRKDLQEGILRHTSEQFIEDPLRVLRVMQFASRFDFEVASETVALSRSMHGEFSTLPVERVGEEWFKALSKAKRPSRALNFLGKSGWVTHFPRLSALIGCPQDEEWHPEGDVWQHTCHCLDALAGLEPWQKLDAQGRYTTMLGVLCHDLGKPLSTKREFHKGLGRKAWVSPGHDRAGEGPAKDLMQQIGVPKAIADQAAALTVYHMEHLRVMSDAQIRRLAVNVSPSSLRMLGLITEADHSGRPPLPKQQPEAMVKILDRAEKMGCLDRPPEPVLGGRHIAQWSSLEPGPAYGILCRAGYEAQLDGKIVDEQTAQEWFRQHRGPILENAGAGPARLLSGHDLLPLYEGKPGPLLGQLHRHLYDLQLDGNLRTTEGAWEYVREHATKYGLSPEKIPVPEPAGMEGPDL